MAIIKRIEGCTRELGKPDDWDDETMGKCNSLPVRDIVIDGQHCMVSAWELEPGELKALQEGYTLKLFIFGKSHPVVSIAVGEFQEKQK